VGFLLSYHRFPSSVEISTVSGFFVGVVLAVGLGLMSGRQEKHEAHLQTLLGGVLLTLPFVRWWGSLESLNDQTAVWALDISFLLAAIIFLWLSTARKQVKSMVRNTSHVEVSP
jgi:ABC-type nitrate/sulfonate/bicarbonate transport system permease component